MSKELLKSFDNFESSRAAILYIQRFYERSLSVRLFSEALHIGTVFNWVNSPYSSGYDRDNGTYAGLIDLLSYNNNSESTLCLMLYLDNHPAGFCRVLPAKETEIQELTEVKGVEYAIHFLQAPADSLKKLGGEHAQQLPAILTSLIANFLVRMVGAERLYLETDPENGPARKLVEEIGYEHLGNVRLNRKLAAIYMISRETILANSDIQDDTRR